MRYIKGGKSGKKLFIYFVLIAPVLIKLVEWAFQIIPSQGYLEAIISVWYIQLIFIEAIALILFFLFFNGTLRERGPLFLGAVYFVKELYNLIFFYNSFNNLVAIALIIEPVFMAVIVGEVIPKILNYFKIVDLR